MDDCAVVVLVTVEAALIALGVCYLINELNAPIKRHSEDDSVDDDAEQEAENFKIGMILISCGTMICTIPALVALAMLFRDCFVSMMESSDLNHGLLPVSKQS
jgi:hypothetical protein